MSPSQAPEVDAVQRRRLQLVGVIRLVERVDQRAGARLDDVRGRAVPVNVLPSTRTCTNTCPTLSLPGVTERSDRFTTSTLRPTTSPIARYVAAIGPSPVPLALRSRCQGPASATSAVADAMPHDTRRNVSW